MELDITKCSVVCCGTPEEKKAVLPVECSMILPDYYPDVMKILRYSAKAVTAPVVSDESGETVSGNVSIEVNYVSEEGEFCLCGQVQPFSHMFVGEGSVAAAEAEAVPGEVSCRAVNQRRIDVHTSLELTLRTVSAQPRDFISCAEGAVCKSSSENVTVIAGEYYKSFTLDEEQEIGYNKPPLGRIIRSSAAAKAEECHVIEDKIVIKGNVRVKMLWTPEREDSSAPEEYCTSCFDFPVSRIIDAPGVGGDDTCDARLCADFPEITAGEDGSTVKIKVRVGAFARVYRTVGANLVTDMFCEKYESDADCAAAEIIGGAFPVEFSDGLRERIDLPEGGEIIDCWTEPVPNPKLSAEGKICFGAKICVFVKNADGDIAYYEKSVEREVAPPAADCGGAFYNLTAETVSEDYTSGRGYAEISAEIFIEGTIYVIKGINAVDSFEAFEDKPRKKDPAAVILYYAEPGEQLWDIAKRYGVDCAKIAAENELATETLAERTMLVIPK